jgi:beta-glucosidase
MIPSRIACVASIVCIATLVSPLAAAPDPQVASRDGSIIEVAGKRFRDLDHNGQLDRYEDWRLTPEQRADDLVARMTLEEKAGTMMHGTLPTSLPGPAGALGLPGPSYDLAKVTELVRDRGITSFLTRLSLAPGVFAEQNNAVQAIAEGSRLGIPVTISTDPRNHFQHMLGASAESKSFSQWPDTLGFGALGDPAIVRRFGDIVRQEYRAVGIHEALSPQADLATEPRWSRVTGTFGSSASIVGPLVRAYVEGFQHGSEGLNSDGVLTVVKHWVGYGAEPEGFDAHNSYGRVARLSDRSFKEHLAAFKGAFAAGVGAVMPTYAIIEGVRISGKPLEPVGAGFSHQLLTDMLRGSYGYNGIILSDWGITNDCAAECLAPTKTQSFREIAMPWGVEQLSQGQRLEKGIEAGLDQFGGMDQPEYIVAAVRSGRISESRVDQSVRRVMIAKFRQDLFENPYVDVGAAERIAGNPEFQKAADDVQRRAQVLLENKRGLLPLAHGRKVYLRGLSAEAARAGGLTVVDRLEDADVAILRMVAPSEILHPMHVFGSRQHEGRLDFRNGDADYEALITASAKVPTIVSIYLDRPAILTNVRDKAAVLLVNFGATDAALLDVITGVARAQGRMPFELPSSMAAVEAQDSAVPDDSARPLYRVRAGITTQP